MNVIISAAYIQKRIQNVVYGGAMKTSAQHYTEQIFTEAITLLVVATAGRCYSCSICESPAANLCV